MVAEKPPQETEGERALSGASRYDRFIAEVVRSEQAWGLIAERWAQVSDHGGTSAMALWPSAEDAAPCATDAWADCTPRPISLRLLLQRLLPTLEYEGLWVLVFPTPTAKGVLVNADALLADLTRARQDRG